MWLSEWLAPDSVPDPSHHLALIYSMWILSGYIDMALLIVAGIFAYRGLRRLTRRTSSARV